ncbi:MAG TPA: AraC family transcriptional regulator [Cyclobacteriaceae bacterium]|nr:AraC family transcriptional regulator [Cyclobacteriaceae bacterium]
MTILYESGFCRVINFLCECTDCVVSKPEYQDRFSLCFIRRGNFIFKTFNSDLDSHTGKILLNKPGYEYRVAHLHQIPDQCTIFSFSSEFFNQLTEMYPRHLLGFLQHRDIQSTQVNSTPGIDYLHHQMFNLLLKGDFSSFQVDNGLIEFVDAVFCSDESVSRPVHITGNEKRNYLPRIEKAKEFIQSSFREKISLKEIAAQSAMSEFHFARIFRRMTGTTPYQYVTDLRLSHATHLLKRSEHRISEISYLSGFSDPSHFSTAFRAKNGRPPKSLR